MGLFDWVVKKHQDGKYYVHYKGVQESPHGFALKSDAERYRDVAKSQEKSRK